MKEICYIMRGVPGSGKSFTAKKLAPKENIFSTDEFWGEDYHFDPSKLGIAHNWNQNRAINAMKSGVSPIVIDNTNTRWREMKPYIDATIKYNYDVIFVEPDSYWWLNTMEIKRNGESKHRWTKEQCLTDLVDRNTHGVPREAIERMFNRWQLTEDVIKQYNELIEK